MVVVGGPGLGKTTLLSQAMAENRLAPRGDDVWLGAEPADGDGDTLARDVAHGARLPVGRSPTRARPTGLPGRRRRAGAGRDITSTPGHASIGGGPRHPCAWSSTTCTWCPRVPGRCLADGPGRSAPGQRAPAVRRSVRASDPPGPVHDARCASRGVRGRSAVHRRRARGLRGRPRYRQRPAGEVGGMARHGRDRRQPRRRAAGRRLPLGGGAPTARPRAPPRAGRRVRPRRRRRRPGADCLGHAVDLPTALAGIPLVGRGATTAGTRPTAVGAPLAGARPRRPGRDPPPGGRPT